MAHIKHYYPWNQRTRKEKVNIKALNIMKISALDPTAKSMSWIFYSMGILIRWYALW